MVHGVINVMAGQKHLALGVWVIIDGFENVMTFLTRAHVLLAFLFFSHSEPHNIISRAGEEIIDHLEAFDVSLFPTT